MWPAAAEVHLARLVEALVAAACRYRRELTIGLAPVIAAGGMLAVAIADPPVAIPAAVLVLVLAIRYRRALIRRAARTLAGARLERRLDAAIANTGLKHPPTVIGREEIGASCRWQVQVDGRTTIGDIASVHESLRAGLQCRTVTVRQDRDRGDRGTITAIYGDPLIHVPPWPGLTLERTDYHQPAPIGVSDMADPMTINGTRKSVLVGGRTGAGKSVAVSLLLAWAALDPASRIYLIDGKVVELQHWKPVAEGFASEPGDAIQILNRVNAEIKQRGEWLAKQPGVRRKLESGDAYGPLIVVIDELADFTLRSEDGKNFDKALGAIAAKGRYVAATAIAATQVPYVDVISGITRANFPLRWAFGCGNRDQSKAILGVGDPDASTLPDQPGMAFLADEDGTWQRMRTPDLDDRTLERVIERAVKVRSEARA